MAILTSHYLNQNRVAWWRATPDHVGGKTWYDLVSGIPAVLTNYTAPDGFRPSTRPNALYHLYALGSNNSYSLISQLEPPRFTFSATTFSVFCWSKSDTFSNYQNPFYRGNSATANFGILVYSGGNWQAQCGGGGATTFGALSTGVWYMLGFTLTGGNLTAYTNGVSTATATGVTPNNSPSGTYFVIGADIGNSRYFDGAVDSAMVFDRALSANEVWALYVDGLLGNPATLDYGNAVAYPNLAAPTAKKVPYHLLYGRTI